MIDFLPIVKALLAECERHDEVCYGPDFISSQLMDQTRQLIQEEEERRVKQETYEQLHE